jgi:GT2 family glycosyltransferase
MQADLPISSIVAIIPAHNAAVWLPACIGAIRASTSAVEEIILFDDGSTDETGAVAAALGARVIRNAGEAVGPGEARNRAARSCTSEVLAFVDSDVVVHADAFSRLASEFASDTVVAVFGSYDDRPPARRIAGQYANLRHHYMHQRAPAEVAHFWAGLGMVRRDAFLSCGGFDPAFALPSIEDIELGARLIARGGRIRVVAGAMATHLKDWRVLQLWRTDIACRAVPWARLIASGRSSGLELNASRRETVAAALAWLVAISFGIALVSPLALAVTAGAAVGYCACNQPFLRLLASRMRGRRLAGAIALHWSYHIYASAIFGLTLAASPLRKVTWQSVRARPSSGSNG